MGYRLAPLVLAILAGNLHGDMAEPAVLLRSVPVLDVGGALSGATITSSAVTTIVNNSYFYVTGVLCAE